MTGTGTVLGPKLGAVMMTSQLEGHANFDAVTTTIRDEARRLTLSRRVPAHAPHSDGGWDLYKSERQSLQKAE